MSAEEAKEYGLIDEIIQGRIKSGGSPNGESNGGKPPARHTTRTHPRRVAVQRRTRDA